MRLAYLVLVLAPISPLKAKAQPANTAAAREVVDDCLVKWSLCSSSVGIAALIKEKCVDLVRPKK
jgi:hypothetical protein